MLRRVGDAEAEHLHVHEGRLGQHRAPRAEVVADMQAQLVHADVEQRLGAVEAADHAVRADAAGYDRKPGLGAIDRRLMHDIDAHARGDDAVGDVDDVDGNGLHKKAFVIQLLNLGQTS